MINEKATNLAVKKIEDFYLILSLDEVAPELADIVLGEDFLATNLSDEKVFDTILKTIKKQ